MRMARVNVYISDELVEEVRAAGLNVSNVAQKALRRELAGRDAAAWLDRVRRLPAMAVTHDDALATIDAARAELGA